MASRIISRGANVNYVNKNGKTALHLLCENLKLDGIKFVLANGGDPHIMDLTGMDVCDKAKQFGISGQFKLLQQCAFRKKIIPIMPNGKHPKFESLPYFMAQKNEREKNMLMNLKNKLEKNPEDSLPGEKKNLFQKLRKLNTIKF